MESTLTNKQRTIDARLRLQGTTLAEWLPAQRAAGLSHEAIADRLRALTGDVVSHETLRLWHRNLSSPKGDAA